MRIVHVAQFLGIGGLEKIIYHLALEQQKQGHQVSVYIYDHDRTWVDFFKKSGLNVITPLLKRPGYDLTLLKRMNCDLENFDIIHSHDLNPLMYLGPLNLWKKLTFKRRPKLVHTTHGLDHIQNYPRGKLYQKVFSRLADKMIGVSEKIGKFYLEDIGLPSSQVTVIQNGITIYEGLIDQNLRKEKKEWIAKRHGLDARRPIILSLSRVVPLKDQKFLIKAFQQRPQLQLIIAGPATDQTYYDELKKMEKENIKLIGPQELVADYNLGADVYVSASTHEGIPVAVLEAMAVETPCLISEIPGHLTLLQYGQYVETFKLNDVLDFLQKLDSIIEKRSESQARSKAARCLVHDHYSVKAMVNNYLKEYAT